MSQQLSVETSQSQPETPQSTTFLDLLRLQMDGLDRTRRRKRTLKERLGFERIGCCGPTWGLRLTTSTTNTREDDEPFDNRLVSGSNHGPVQLNQGMNLAAALAAERNYRTEETVASSSGSLTPLRVSLMRLLEETAERVVVEGNETASSSSTVRGGGGGNDSMCCVCMGRKKGAALIPCGHTFCRVCSREVWLNRGSCPLCNRPIIEILDIY